MHFIYIPRHKCVLQASSSVGYGKNSRFGAVSTNGSKSDLGYALAMFAGSITKAVNWKLVKLQIEVNRVFLISFRPGLDAVLHMSRVGRVVP